MLFLRGYKDFIQIHESTNSTVYRARREKDDRPVILKFLNRDYPSSEQIRRYKQEYNLTQKLDASGIIKAYSLEEWQRSYVIILEDFGGISLKQWLKEREQLTLKEFLEIAIAIAETLSQIHACNVIHKDINPANLIFNPQTKELKIIDFGISTQLSRENPTLKNPNVLEGTLAYISPEQTGRMNRELDYRTDFYSLGVTFYELLMGQLPFTTEDPLELVHCHIAKSPLPTSFCLLPTPLVDIVMKLMAKNAEDRYQSAYGLKADLENCQQQLEQQGNIEFFALGGQDVSDRFQIPQKLYGREVEIEKLLATFRHVTETGNIELMLVAGYSGIGKSSLVQELYKPITECRGYFISGKFDQFQRNIPYSALIAALRNLINQLLGETEERLHIWQEKILQALGNNGQVIIDVIPEVELVIGKQPPVPILGVNEADNRFNLVFGNFINVFCEKEHPLTLFLDDLQWSDLATLKLLERLLSERQTQYLLLLGAYRDNEVSVDHPLTMFLTKLQQNTDKEIEQIILNPLPLEQITALISDTLGIRETKVFQKNLQIDSFAQLVYQKTEGNPFFINEFLQALHDGNLLNFDSKLRSWQWDMEAIASRNFTDNVVELMVEKLQQLPQGDREILSLAACLGAEFDLTTLTWIAERSPQDVFALLKIALDRYFISPSSELDENLLIQSYKFAHDRIQQAAYLLIPDTEKAEKNVAIGRILLEKIPESDREERLFDIVDRLNCGISCLEDSQEREKLTRLNLQAGCKARKANAYEAAIAYFETGISLLEEDSWVTQYSLTLELYQEAMKAAYLNAEIERMEALAVTIAKEAKTPRDRLELGKIKVEAYTNQGRFSEALAVGFETLATLGIEFPPQLIRSDIKPPPGDPSLLQNPFTRRLLFFLARVIPDRYLRNSNLYPLLLLKEFAKIQASIGDRSPVELANSPEMQDGLMRESLGLLVKIAPVIYLIYNHLSPLTLFKQLELSLVYGNAPASVLGYAAYGNFLCLLGDESIGYEYAQLALDIFARFNDRQFAASLYLAIYHYVVPWTKHLRDTLSPLQQGFALSLEIGDLAYSGYLSNAYCIHLYFSGWGLSEIQKELEHHRKILEAIGQKTSLQNNLMYWYNILILQGCSNIPYRLDGVAIDDSLFLSLFQDNPIVLFQALVFKGIRDYLFERLGEAKATIVKAKKYLSESEGYLLFPIGHFYASLIQLSQARSSHKKILNGVCKNQKKMKQWAKSAPMNYLHKFYLVEAEYYRVLGERVKAMDYYDRAIALAKENKYIQEEALANELAAKFYLNWELDCAQPNGKEKIARLYLIEAHYCYQRWGATAKVKHLEVTYPHLLSNPRDRVPNTTLQQNTRITRTSSNLQAGESLDIASVFKATRAISSEIVLDRLLSALMEILVENAGAQRGVLLLANQTDLTIAAIKEIDAEKAIALPSTPLEEFPKIPISIVRYVARTRESLFLDDATRENSFANDSYIQQYQCHSLACIPFINQGQLQGIAYLENNLIVGAFTKKQVESVQILAGQAAIAISNAQLYGQLTLSKQKIQELYDASKRFVPEQFLGLLEKKSIIDVKLGDRVEREMTILFSDIRDFTTLSEQMTPKENFTFINNYLGRMEPLIQKYGGFIDKYIGDAIMALFGNTPDDALQAAISMLEELKQYNTYRQEIDRPPLRIGIGLHTGRLMLGMVGGIDRMDGTAIGDAVNLSSRVEGLTKTYGISLLMTHQTLAKLNNPLEYDLRFIEQVKAKGKAKAVGLFEVFSADPPQLKQAKRKTKEKFERAVMLFHWRSFSKAARLFEECLDECEGDRTARIYRDRCEGQIG